MSKNVKLSDRIVQMGNEFPIDAMEDYDQRIRSGEFENLTYEEIRSIYLREAIESEEQETLREQQEELGNE